MSHSREHTREYAVIGLSRFGASVALTLADHGCTVLGIDRDRDAVQSVADRLTHAMILDATDEAALRHADINLYDVVIVAIDDFSSAVITALVLKELKVPHVVCAAIDDRQRTILLKIGVDQVVMPEVDAGRHLALSLFMPSIVDQLALGNGYAIAEVAAPPALATLTVDKAQLSSQYDLTLVAIKRADKPLISPAANEVIKPSDMLIVLGRTADIERLTAVQ